jgi:probable F420-dependent oxidoreductase
VITHTTAAQIAGSLTIDVKRPSIYRLWIEELKQLTCGDDLFGLLREGVMEVGKLGIWYFFDGASSADAATSAKRMEELGYDTLWLPETVGKNPFVLAAWLLANTTKLKLATGIANIYHREPTVSRALQYTLAEQSADRFLMAIGVSHKPLVEGVRKLEYGPPVATMRNYLEQMDTAPYNAVRDENDPLTLIAALGPKMLELAKTHTQGAHPYFTGPSHTKMAREILGEGPLLCVEQKVILETNAEKARELARPVAKIYNRLPNYRNNWLRMGLTEDDIDNLSDRFIDETFAWGDVDALRERINEHMEAGADHVCIQPVNTNGVFGDIHWECLEALSPAG